MCKLDHYFIAEPQTKMAPKLKDSKIELKREIFAQNSTIALMCIAQGSPVPFYRWIYLHNNLFRIQATLGTAN